MWHSAWTLSLVEPLVVVGIVASLVAAVLVAGIMYQVLGGRRDRAQLAQEGQTISLGNGSSLYLYSMGQGGPTVVFEAGFGATHLNWRHVQRAVSSQARAVAYDRAGLGWSGPCRSRRTPSNIAMELHEALHKAGIEPPFVLVGHSFGGLVMRRFALLYPDEVAGITLIDPMRCEEWPPLNAARVAEVNKGRKLTRIAIPVARFGVARFAARAVVRRAELTQHAARVTGATGTHVIDRVTTEVRKMPPEIWPVLAAHWSRPDFYLGMRRHLDAVPASVEEMQDSPPLHDIRVTVLTPASATPLSLECLARIGDQVEQVIAHSSAHWVHLDEPDLVIDAIRAHIHSSSFAEYAQISSL